MPDVIDWQNAPDPHAVVRRAVEVLDQGGLLVVPTETAYVVAASALHADAVAQLPEHPLSLVVSDSDSILDWVPDLGRLGRRLARRCWPGPVTFAYPLEIEQGVGRRLPEPVRRRLCPNEVVRLRCPAHELLLHVAASKPDPVVVAGASLLGQPLASTAEAAVREFGDRVQLVIDDGPAPNEGPTTVVRIEGESWWVEQPGVVTEEQLRRQTVCLVAFICTGNTCRSPMAEALCKKQLADRLGCGVDELVERGFLVLSAGVAAMMGGSAAEEARAVVQEHGGDLSQHRSQMISAALVAQADYLVVMTESHRHAVLAAFGHLHPQVRLLNPAGDDLEDPVGGDREVYRACAREIAEHLRGLVDEMTEGLVRE